MTRTMILSFTRLAQADLVRLREFIAKHSELSAERVSTQLLKGIMLLSKHPRLGRRVVKEDGDAAPEEVRDWMAGDYVVRYLIADQRLIVLRVWHQRENWLN